MLQGTPEYLTAHTSGRAEAAATPTSREAVAQRRARRRSRLGAFVPMWGTRSLPRARYSMATWVLVLVALAVVTGV